jgi:Arc/MetJ-type ribon-helix-helix transcriptional regulator
MLRRSITIDKELVAWLERRAVEQEQSVSAAIRYAVRRMMIAEETQKAAKAAEIR